MYILNCDDIIITYFNISKKKELTFKDLNIIRRDIESKNESYFVDVSYSAIRNFVIKFQKYIEIENNKIILINKGLPKIKTTTLTDDCIEVITKYFNIN